MTRELPGEPSSWVADEAEEKYRMEVRDKFAAAALQGLLFKHGMGQGEKWLAEQSYRLADFMLKER